MLARDRNNIFLKKILEKGSRFLYDEQELRKEVLGKLRKVRGEVEQNPSNLFSVEKKLSTIKRKKGSDKSKTANSVDKYRPRPRTSVNKEEFLSFEKGKEVVERYRRKIREIDCSLPQNHIKKTISLLRNMENIVERLTSWMRLQRFLKCMINIFIKKSCFSYHLRDTNVQGVFSLSKGF